MVVRGERGEVIGKVAGAAGTGIVGSVELKGGGGEGGSLGAGEESGVDVGGVNLAPVVEALFGEEDSEGIGLFAGRAAGNPDAYEGVGTEDREDVKFEGKEEGGVAKEGGGVDGEVEEEAVHGEGIVEDQVLEGRDGVEVEGAHGMGEAAQEGGGGVVAEVVAIVLVHPFEE